MIDQKRLDIKSATVILTSGADLVSLALAQDLPSPVWPFDAKGNFTLEFRAANGTGIEYVRQNFGIEPIVINTRAGLTKQPY